MKKLLAEAAGYLSKKRRHNVWMRIVAVLGCIVVFCTTYALILPAITVENKVICGQEEHQHSESCYSRELVCDKEESEGHIHTDDCYETMTILICDQEEDENHTHGDECYESSRQLVCEQEEAEAHVHTDDCYSSQNLVCGLEEHVHDLTCYEDESITSDTSQDESTATDIEESTSEVQTEATEENARITQTYEAEAKDYTVSVSYGPEAEIPEGATLKVTEYPKDSEVYLERYEKVSELNNWEEDKKENTRLFDIGFYLEEEKVQPAAEVEVKIIYSNQEENTTYSLMRFLTAEEIQILGEEVEEKDKIKTIVSTASYADGSQEIDFRENTFSDFMIVAEPEKKEEAEEVKEVEAVEETTQTDLFTKTYEGDDYTVTVSYDAKAEIPEEAELKASEYEKDSDTYKKRYEEAEKLYGWEEDKTDSIRLFNIGFYVGEEEVEPAAPVSVRITYSNQEENRDYAVTHFGEEETEEIPVSVEYESGKQNVDFELEGFSDIMLLAVDVNTSSLDGKTFAIIGAQNAVLTATTKRIGNNNGLAAQENSYTTVQDETSGFYNLATYDESEKTALDNFLSSYKIWTFEKAGSAANSYYLTTTANGSKQYLRISGSNVTLANRSSNEAILTVGTGTGNNAGKISIARSGYGINLNGGSISNGFNSYGNLDTNSYFYLVENTQVLPMPDTVEGVSPTGTLINVFDYWTGERWPDGGDYSEGNRPNQGINSLSPLQFTTGVKDTLNEYTGSEAVRQGIVQNKLSNGYPLLSSTYDNNNTSLAYLFDPTNTDASGYRQTFRNAKGLLQVSQDGYYYYDSTKNFAELNEETNDFTLYNKWGVNSQNGGEDGQFFPFNKFADVADQSAQSSRLNHYFGLTLTSRFIQRYDGYTDSSKTNHMSFEFSGDDDVWIFIDDVLVADLGGIHDAASVNIDFATGNVSINGTQTTTLKSAFTDAGAQRTVEWNESNTDIFANNTYHTLKFFYLERGNVASNLHLKYNLSSYPPTGIYKVDQNDEMVSGAQFAVYKTDANHNIIDDEPVYTGATDASGEMVFVDEDGMPYTLTELKSMFGEYFVLKETSVPAGYRMVNDEIKLHIQENVLVCINSEESGVWAGPNLRVSAPNTIYLHTPHEGSRTVNIVNEKQQENGKVFAVVLKYTGARDASGNATDLTNQTSWSPVYGNARDGFTLVDGGDSFDSFIQAVIDTAKQYTESNNVFSLSASGAMEGDLEGMPGDVSKYYYMLPPKEKGKTEYTVGYYWTSAGSLEDANVGNTYRIDADGATDGTAQYKFERVFGATIHVSNLVNRLIVQKLDEEKKLVNGAVFAVYKVQEEGNTIYYVADDDDNTLISLAKDEDGDNKGEAIVRGNSTDATYTVDKDTGDITVKAGDTTYTISPAINANGEPLYQTTQSSEDVKEEGTIVYSYLLPDKYYIREISAPDGYTINTTEVMALVTDNAVYANAGTADDGVSVARGPGYLIKNMQQFASKGQIDNTLTWIYTQLKISNVSHSFDGVNATDYYDSWKYINKNYAVDFDEDTISKDGSKILTPFLEYNPNREGTLFNYSLMEPIQGDTEKLASSKTRRLYTDIGWSYLEIYQNYSYGSQNHVAGANYEEWSGDISNLFSRSVYIQVTDKQVSKLRISKTVSGNEKLPESEKDTTGFEFKVNLYQQNEEESIPLSGQYAYTIYKINSDGSEDSNVGEGTISNDESTINLTDGQYVIINNLPPDAKYTVTETRNSEYAITAMKDSASVELEAYRDGVVKGDLSWKTVDDVTTNISTVDFTNIYLPDIGILKVAAEDNKTTLKGAEFVLYYKVTNDSETTDYYYSGNDWVTLTDTITENDVKLTSDEHGKIEFSNIADGVYYLKEITAPDGYKLLEKEIVITVKNGVIESAQDKDGTTIYTPTNDNILTVQNSAGIKLPDTGGEGTDWYTYSGLLLIVVAFVWGYIMRRKNERRGRA